jgi:hypothetical protein
MQFVLPWWLVAAAAVQQRECTQLYINTYCGDITRGTVATSNCLEGSSAAGLDGTFLAPQWFRLERASVSRQKYNGSFQSMI